MKKNNLKLYIFVIISYCYVINAEIGCQDEDGSSVDWWAAIKYPDGTTYAYADANSDSFKLSSNDMKYKTTGALSETLQQVYKGSSKTVGYAMYNDESPNGDKFGTVMGTFKGVVATDKSNGFWLIHSAPRFPETVANGYDVILILLRNMDKVSYAHHLMLIRSILSVYKCKWHVDIYTMRTYHRL